MCNRRSSFRPFVRHTIPVFSIAGFLIARRAVGRIGIKISDVYYERILRGRGGQRENDGACHNSVEARSVKVDL